MKRGDCERSQSSIERSSNDASTPSSKKKVKTPSSGKGGGTSSSKSGQQKGVFSTGPRAGIGGKPRIDYIGEVFDDKEVLYRVTPYRTVKSSNGKWAWQCQVCRDKGESTIGNLRHKKVRGCSCVVQRREEEKLARREKWVGEDLGDRTVTAYLGELSWSYICRVCGHEGQTTVQQMRNQPRCPECSKRDRGQVPDSTDYTGHIFGTREVVGREGDGWAWACTECDLDGVVTKIESLKNSGCMRCYHNRRAAEVSLGLIKNNKKIIGVRRGTKGRLYDWVCLRCDRKGTQERHTFHHSGCSFCGGRLLDAEVIGRVPGSSKTIISRSDAEGNGSQWNWVCDCGNTGVGTYGGCKTKRCISCKVSPLENNINVGDEFDCLRLLEQLTPGRRGKWRYVCLICGEVGTMQQSNLGNARKGCWWCRRLKPIGDKVGVVEIVGYGTPGTRNRDYHVCCTLCGTESVINNTRFPHEKKNTYCLDCTHDVLGMPVSCRELGRLLSVDPEHLRRLNRRGSSWEYLLTKYKLRALRGMITERN